MKIRISYDSMLDWLIYIGMFFYLFANLLQTSFYFRLAPDYTIQAAGLMSIVFFILREILRDEIKIGSLYSFFYFILMVIMVIWSSKGFDLYVYGLIFMWFLRDFPFKKSARFALFVVTAFLIFVIVTSQLGLVKDFVEITSERTRHYLGFRYSLFPSTLMLEIIALNIYLKGKEIGWLRLGILFGSAFWIYRMTDSRLAFISSMILLVVAVLMKMIPNFLGKVRAGLFVMIPSYFYAALFSYFTVSQYDTLGSTVLALDKFLGRRIYLANKSLDLFGFRWVGQRINWIGNGLNAEGQRSSSTFYLYVDNLYIQVLQRYGWVFLFLLCLLLTMLLIFLYRRKQYTLMVILILLAFHATIDDLIFRLHYNIFWIMGFASFMDNKEYFTRDLNVELDLNTES